MDYTFEITSDESYDNFVKYLYSKAKDESVKEKEIHRNIINSEREIIAISMSEIRRIAKMISKHDIMKFLKFSKDSTYEEVLIQGIVITYVNDINLQISLLDNWIKKIDCWALCDSVVSSMKLFSKSEEKDNYFDHFYKMCFSEDEFTSRFGIVTLLVYYLEDRYIDKIYEMCRSVTNSAYYVKMAIAWLISYGFIKFKEKTYSLLEERVLDKFTQNKSICKCRESYKVDKIDKEKLLSYRIK